MTRLTNARIAGVTFLAYIAAGITDMRLHARATAGTDIAGRLASIAQHVGDLRYSVLLGMVQVFCALVLAVTLYAITRDEDRDLAMLGMICRIAEGVIGALSVPETLGLLWLATATGADAPDRAAAHALAAYLMRGGVAFTAAFFAVGSTLFAWLLLRGRMIPIVLGWIGVFASVLLVICIPLQLVGLLRGPLTQWMWLPMLFFEVPLALWFLIKGVAVPPRAQAAYM
ncbi:MAG TPA: DUF4386 domain-containing protein [Terriglobales bacterium]|nr:DUF4386 domain-containing protein [Terriglobales bacterium]